MGKGQPCFPPLPGRFVELNSSINFLLVCPKGKVLRGKGGPVFNDMYLIYIISFRSIYSFLFFPSQYSQPLSYSKFEYSEITVSVPSTEDTVSTQPLGEGGWSPPRSPNQLFFAVP